MGKLFIAKKEPQKLNVVLSCLMKLVFSNHNLKHYKSHVQPWTSFASDDHWELNSMGYWQRKSKWILEMKKEEQRLNGQNLNDSDSQRPDHKCIDIRDPHYLCFETIRDHQSLLKQQGLYKLVTNMMEHSW